MAKLKTEKTSKGTIHKATAAKNQPKETTTAKKISAPPIKETKQKMGFFKTWAKIMFEPNAFFEQLPKEVKYKEPSIFAIKIQAFFCGLFILNFFIDPFNLSISFYLLSLIFLVIATFFLPFLGINFFGIGNTSSFLIALIIFFPFALLFGLIMLFVSARIYHLFVLMFGGKEDYKETFKAITYAGAPAPLIIIPYVGILSLVYIIFLEIIGIHHRQKLSIGKSVAVVLIPLIIVLFLTILLLYPFFPYLMITMMN
jgi:hypothetical protein